MTYLKTIAIEFRVSSAPSGCTAPVRVAQHKKKPKPGPATLEEEGRPAALGEGEPSSALASMPATATTFTLARLFDNFDQDSVTELLLVISRNEKKTRKSNR